MNDVLICIQCGCPLRHDTAKIGSGAELGFCRLCHGRLRQLQDDLCCLERLKIEEECQRAFNSAALKEVIDRTNMILDAQTAKRGQ